MCVDCKDCEIYLAAANEENSSCTKGFGKCCEECGDVYCFKRETGDINAFETVF